MNKWILAGVYDVKKKWGAVGYPWQSRPPTQHRARFLGITFHCKGAPTASKSLPSPPHRQMAHNSRRGRPRGSTREEESSERSRPSCVSRDPFLRLQIGNGEQKNGGLRERTASRPPRQSRGNRYEWVAAALGGPLGDRLRSAAHKRWQHHHHHHPASPPRAPRFPTVDAGLVSHGSAAAPLYQIAAQPRLRLWRRKRLGCSTACFRVPADWSWRGWARAARGKAERVAKRAAFRDEGRRCSEASIHCCRPRIWNESSAVWEMRFSVGRSSKPTHLGPEGRGRVASAREVWRLK